MVECALPVTGSSGTPQEGQNTRLTTCGAPVPPPSLLLIPGPHAVTMTHRASTLAKTAKSGVTASTSAGVGSSMR